MLKNYATLGIKVCDDDVSTHGKSRVEFVADDPVCGHKAGFLHPTSKKVIQPKHRQCTRVRFGGVPSPARNDDQIFIHRHLKPRGIATLKFLRYQCLHEPPMSCVRSSPIHRRADNRNSEYRMDDSHCHGKITGNVDGKSLKKVVLGGVSAEDILHAHLCRRNRSETSQCNKYCHRTGSRETQTA